MELFSKFWRARTKETIGIAFRFSLSATANDFLFTDDLYILFKFYLQLFDGRCIKTFVDNWSFLSCALDRHNDAFSNTLGSKKMKCELYLVSSLSIND